uniref:Uncharacterized protein n=1 Tax=Cannabis sativa TaxID=3483 RepID=A0A803PM89_CANSA
MFATFAELIRPSQTSSSPDILNPLRFSFAIVRSPSFTSLSLFFFIFLFPVYNGVCVEVFGSRSNGMGNVMIIDFAADGDNRG